MPTTVVPLGDLREWLGVEVGQQHDDLLTALEARAVDQVGKLCHLRLAASASVTEYHNGNGSQVLWLDYPGTAVGSVSTRANVTESWTVLSSTLYELDGRKLYGLDAWPEGLRNIKVVYTAGYSAPLSTSIPRDVYQLILDYCKHMYREGRVMSQEDLSLDGWMRQPFVAQTLGRYARPLL